MIRPFREIEFEIVDVAPSGTENQKRFYIIGTAEKGELLNPIRINNFDQAFQTFGMGSLIEMVESIYEVTGEISLTLIRTDWKNNLQETIDTLKFLDFRYLLVDHNISFTKHFDIILKLVDLMKEAILKKGYLSHMFISLDYEHDESRFEYQKEMLRSLYANDETSAVAFLSIILDQIKERKAHAFYAGLFLIQDVQDSPRNKRILSNEQQSRFELYYLSEPAEVYYEKVGVVTMRDSFHHGYIFTTDVLIPAEDPTSHYSYLTSVKAVSHVLETSRLAASALIGVISLEPKRVVREVFRHAMQIILETGKVKDLKFEVFNEESPYHFHVVWYVMPHFSVDYIKQKTSVIEVKH